MVRSTQRACACASLLRSEPTRGRITTISTPAVTFSSSFLAASPCASLQRPFHRPDQICQHHSNPRNLARVHVSLPLLAGYKSTTIDSRNTPCQQQRHFHDYFVTHLPKSSLHPDMRESAGPQHQLPRAASSPHIPRSTKDPIPVPLHGGNRDSNHNSSSSSGGSVSSHGHNSLHASRDTTVVRIPLRSAKHHFGVSVSRGQRPYNEDTYQAGVIDLPAFTKQKPRSVTSRRAPPSSPLQAYRDRQQQQQQQEKQPQQIGKQEQHSNDKGIPIDKGKGSAATEAEDGGARAAGGSNGDPQVFYFGVYDGHGGHECSDFLRDTLHEYIEVAARDLQLGSTLQVTPGAVNQELEARSEVANKQSSGSTTNQGSTNNSKPSKQKEHNSRALELESALIKGWKDLVGGYFRRFKPALFSESEAGSIDISTILTYAFLRADFDFVRAQARKADDNADPVVSDAPLNASDILDKPSLQIGGPKRFKGGSTCSIALVSTPTPIPFWNPSTHSTLVVAHVGDTRVLLCRTSDGQAVTATTNHHPSNPEEGRRLRRYAGNIVTDSFGEERMSGLANTRAFGDMQSKRIGVSAEPEIRRMELGPAEYSFLVLVSDGISGTLTDQEVVDVVKEAKTPEQGARDVVSFATEVSAEGDNATCICVRLGGWERRSEGGGGSLGTREQRDYRRQEAADPRRRH